MNFTFLSGEAHLFPLAEDSDLVCQPGARWMDINETLKEKGITKSHLPLSLLGLIVDYRNPVILPCEAYPLQHERKALIFLRSWILDLQPQ